MKYQFDKIVDRKNTNCEKWDGVDLVHDDVISAWVADMDFESPPQIAEALQQRLSHQVFGYTYMIDEQYEAIQNWIAKRHGHKVEKEWIIQSAGVVCTLNASVDELLKDGGYAVIFTPCYPPFYTAAEDLNHKKLECSLKLVDGKYQIDFECLEQCFENGAKVLILCNPHNPVGRVWTYEELDKIGKLCAKYDVKVISDDIHCDLILPGKKYVSALSVDSLKDRTVLLISATKTFNIAGLQTSSAIIKDEGLREAIYKRLKRYGHGEPNIFGITAQYTAYSSCEDWLDELLILIDTNFDIMLDALKDTKLKVYKPEGTYLMWIDCNELGIKDEEIMDFFIEKCKVYPSWGKSFGDGQFIRLNLAAPQKIIQKIAENIRNAVLY